MNRVVSDESERKFRLKERIFQKNTSGNEDFQNYLVNMKTSLSNEINRESSRHGYDDLQALIGYSGAIDYFMNEIEKHIRKQPFNGQLPAAYTEVREALFQEWKGFGPAYHWLTNKKYADSTGMQIIGKQIFFNDKGRFVQYPYEMSSDNRVEQLRRQLMTSDPSLKLNRDNPSAELKMDDPLWPGRYIRLALWVPPRVWDGFTTISMRRQVVEYLSLDDQAGTGAIPSEAISMIRALSQTYRNTIIAGPVGSGKTTFANTIVGEQLNNATSCMGVVMIEKHPESILPYQIKGHRIIPIKAANEELMEVGVESLRHDPNILYMTEMRYNEWEFYLWSGEKGYDGMTGTFHTIDAEDIPYQGAFAVSTRLGGSLKGHLMSALKSCELVFILKSDGDGSQKRLTRISEVYYDEADNTVYAHDIMRYEKGSWSYHNKLSNGILERMERKDAAATKTFLNELDILSLLKPMVNPIKESIKSRMVLREGS
ncbi:ATPase, T2SS/T4P/T4SS family [Paenibacillus ihuae]|uniref:ATPase, T2SS/T4P/T4SS family n=1 Tax=Paenibacillus ihuae TaxID=1232431 RepID=UPI0006D562D5|nr:ATPase, T2SS/T4P/T4SS family [Paenibacillus ihuae]